MAGTRSSSPTPDITSPDLNLHDPYHPSSYTQVPMDRSPSPSDSGRRAGPFDAGGSQNSRGSRFGSSPLNSSPLNPFATPERVPGGTRPASWNSSMMLDRPINEPSSDDSSGSHSEKEVIKGIMAGSVGGGLGPYPTIPAMTEHTGGGPFRGSLGMGGVHNRFSTVSSVGSVLSFATDSKYAYPLTPSTAAFLPYQMANDADPRASFLPSDQYGQYDRLDGPVDDDDHLHEPDSKTKVATMSGANWRGLFNIVVLISLLAGLLTLFAGYPIISHYTRNLNWEKTVVNGTGQVPERFGLPSLIDPETPHEVYARTGYDGHDYELVFSDEFNTPGRSFYPGDDPFWEAADLHYWSTGDLEYYDPSQITTRNGALAIVLEQVEDHGLQFRSGMLQSWNKFCFTTGYIEVSLILPGQEDVSGYWPGAWIMGNLGRGGYGSTNDGTWPYTYNSCDVGTLPNQTHIDGSGPAAALTGGSAKYNYELSWLPGQRLSACTCPNEDHPGPDLSSPKGRGAPEIDILEAQKNKEGPGGRVTQSAQIAPFSASYYFPNSSTDIPIADPTITKLNSYRGSGVQQAISGLTNINATNFAAGPGQFTSYGFEWWSNPANPKEGFIDWMAGKETFKATSTVWQGDPTVEISDRLVSEEPSSIILNLAIAESFQKVDLAAMVFPSELLVDYVRVWQRKGLKNALTCDPPDYPTANYINAHLNAYTNPNYTTWAEAGYAFPKNSMRSGGC